MRHDLAVNRGRPDFAHDSTADPDTPVAKAAALLLSQDLQPVFGPYLRFNNFDIDTSLWTGSVLIVTHHSVTSRPFLNFTSGMAGNQSSEGILLDTYGQHNFWRFGLGTPLGPQPQILQYSLNYGQGSSMPPGQSYTVHLPSRDQPWHWAFHSCSGFSLSVQQADWGGVAPLWRDLLEQHQASPLHLVVGGGDQLYNDALFKVLSPSQLKSTQLHIDQVLSIAYGTTLVSLLIRPQPQLHCISKVRPLADASCRLTAFCSTVLLPE